MRRIAVPEPLPSFVPPMLLESGPPALLTEEWAVEVKFDGIRAQLRVDGGDAWTVRSRRGRNCTSEFPELQALASRLADHRIILDGELVHLGTDGRPDFSAVRSRLTGGRSPAHAANAATYVAFDILHFDGRAVRALPYRERRALLAEVLPPGDGWRLAPSWTERLGDVVAVTREHELEGVVFKRLDSPYRPGRRSHAWRKQKHLRRESLSIAAWTPGNGEPDTFYLARPSDDGEPRFAGTVQLGMDTAAREQLRRLVSARDLGAPRSQRVRRIAPGISLIVSGHGPTGTPLRDAVIKGIVVGDGDESPASPPSNRR